MLGTRSLIEYPPKKTKKKILQIIYHWQILPKKKLIICHWNLNKKYPRNYLSLEYKTDHAYVELIDFTCIYLIKRINLHLALFCQ